jgi:uridine kinase
MLRSQSINACVDDIFETSRSMGFVKINLIGASSSGKTVLADVLAHQLHKKDPTFEVHSLQDSDLIDFKKTIQGLSTNNQILKFDDLSGLVAKYGKTALENLRSQKLLLFRHIGESNQDRKIIMILNFHAQKMLDKFLRISNLLSIPTVS